MPARGYMLADVERLKREVLAAIPDAKVDDWRDYGFALEVAVGERHVIACQPARDDTGQPEVFLDVPEIKRRLALH